MYIEALLRDIDADEARSDGRLFHDPSLRMRARLAAQATVRVRGGTDGRGALLFLGLTHPGGAPGSRPSIGSPTASRPATARYKGEPGAGTRPFAWRVHHQ